MGDAHGVRNVHGGGHGRCGGICGGCCWGMNWCGVLVGWGHNDTSQRREVRQYKACCRIVGPVCCLRTVSRRSGRTEQSALPAGGPFVLHRYFKPQLRQDKTRVLLVCAPSPPSCTAQVLRASDARPQQDPRLQQAALDPGKHLVVCSEFCGILLGQRGCICCSGIGWLAEAFIALWSWHDKFLQKSL